MNNRVQFSSLKIKYNVHFCCRRPFSDLSDIPAPPLLDDILPSQAFTDDLDSFSVSQALSNSPSKGQFKLLFIIQNLDGKREVLVDLNTMDSQLTAPSSDTSVWSISCDALWGIVNKNISCGIVISRM